MCPEACERDPLLLSPDRTSDGRAREYSKCSITGVHIFHVHMARRQITRVGFHCIQLFHIASDKEAFHHQQHNRTDRTEPLDTLDQDEVETTCAKCITGENESDWIKCPRCSQWYHDAQLVRGVIHLLSQINPLLFLDFPLCRNQDALPFIGLP